MQHPFKAAQLAVCVDNVDYHPASKAHRLKLGCIYRVEVAFFDKFGRPGVTLTDVDHRPAEGWHAFRFKPLRFAAQEFSRACSELARSRQREGIDA